MAEQPRTPEDVYELVREHDVRFIRLWSTDVLGLLKSFSINASGLERAFEVGIGFDGASLTGFNPAPLCAQWVTHAGAWCQVSKLRSTCPGLVATALR